MLGCSIVSLSFSGFSGHSNVFGGLLQVFSTIFQYHLLCLIVIVERADPISGQISPTILLFYVQGTPFIDLERFYQTTTAITTPSTIIPSAVKLFFHPRLR